MTLTKQQKFDMIYDLELRLAKEELVEQHVKNMAAIETSKKPMQTAKDIMRRNPPSSNKVDMKEKENAIAGHALHKHQRDQWHNLSEQQFKELKSLPQNSDIESFADKKQSELESLLKHQRQDIERLEKSEHPLKTEQDILYSYDDALDPKIMANMKQKFDHQSVEEKELLEQSEIATRAPFKKDGLDSKTQWEFSGLETQAMHESVSKETRGFTVTEEQMQEFREEYYGGRHNALETLNQHSQENGYVTQEQLNQFTIDRVESELRADNILHNSQEELSMRNEEQQVDFNLQEHFDNAQSMSNNHGMEMER